MQTSRRGPRDRGEGRRGRYLEGILAAIDVITKEQEAARGKVHAKGPEDVGEGEKVGEVAVEVTEDVDGALELEESALIHKNVA